MRCLIVRERLVPADRVADYGAAWLEVSRRATSVSAHAWAFSSTSDAGRFMEFVEWRGDTGSAVATPGEAASPGPPPSISSALAHLDSIAPPLSSSAWKEWSPA